MDSFERKLNERQETYLKKNFHSSDPRRRREDGLLDLRRNQRQEAIAKRRQNLPSSEPTGTLDPSQLSRYTAQLNSPDLETQLKCTVAIRKIISNKNNPPIDQVIASGALPRIIEFLAFDNSPKLQFESAWILTNVASGSSFQTAPLISHGAVPQCVRLLRSAAIEVAEQVCWVLGNIAGDSVDMRNHVLENNAIDPLLELLLRSKKESVIRTACWAISNICKGKPEPDFSHMQKCLPFLSRLVHCDDLEVVSDACWALSFISDENTTDNHKIEAVIQTGCVPRVVQVLENKKAIKNLRVPALRIIGNIVTGSDTQTQTVIDCNALPTLLSLLDIQEVGIRKETVWTISNISAGTVAQVEAIINQGLAKKVIDMFSSEKFEIRREIIWAISNLLASGTIQTSNYVARQGGLKCLIEILSADDIKIVQVALEGIHAMLESGRKAAEENKSFNALAQLLEELGGIEQLEDAQHHENEDIYKKAAYIIRTYFAGEDEETELAPNEVQGEFQFGGSDNSNSGFCQGFKF